VPSLSLEFLATRRLLLRQLKSLPLFAGCGSRVALAARWGEVVGAMTGDVLAIENSSAHWFFFVLTGTVDVGRRGEPVATLHRGDYFGERDIVAFAPQSATLVAAEPSVLFVLDRRYLLSLIAIDDRFRRHLFPGVEAAQYRDFERALRAEGHLEWQRVGPHTALASRAFVPGAKRTHRKRGETVPGRAMSWREAVSRLFAADAGATSVDTPDPPRGELSPASKAVVWGVVGAVVAALIGLAFLYHPPVAVVSAGPVIDVSDDIQVAGIDVQRPTGRYLLLTVRTQRPTLVGAALAWARGRRLLTGSALDLHGVDPETARRRGRDTFLNSQNVAVQVAEHVTGVNGESVNIVIRDRGFTGPSGGLIYALALEDMLDPADLAEGRVIAATGSLEEDGRIGRVGWVSLKAEAARMAGAQVLIVPEAQQDQATGRVVSVYGATTLEEATQIVKGASAAP